VERSTGIKTQVISGTEEARLIHLAAVYGVDVAGASAVVIDIGGGSVEVTHGAGAALRLAKSFKLGVIRLTERYVHSDPLSGHDEKKLVKHLDQELGPYLKDISTAGFDRVIGTSGTILSLGTVATAERRSSDDVRNLRVPAKQIHRLRKHIAQADRYPDVRKRSVIELAERCSYWPEHAHQIARLAGSIFDQTRDIHGLGDREREWLEFAALLHDIGTHISYTGHHKHSYYLVKNGDLRGFEPEEIDVIALMTRYHRKSPPKKTHAPFAALRPKLRDTVRDLSAILRLAESLDRSHSQTISAVELHDRGKEFLVKLRTTGDAELELWAALRQLAPFEAFVGKSVRVSAGKISYAEQSKPAARVPGKAVRGRRHRWIRQDDAARAAGEVAERRGTTRLRDGVELLSAGKGGDKGRQKEERLDADDVQPVTRH
jgi:exopolyphosphatase/pppGpp-phosphohydrolase